MDLSFGFSCLVILVVISSQADATLFKYKYEKKQDFLDQLKAKRALSHHGFDYSRFGQFGNGGFFGFTGYDNLFKHGITVPIPVPKPVPISFTPIPIPHPVPITTKTIAIPVPFHFGKQSLGDFGLSSAYDTALANYAQLSHDHYQQQHHHHQQQQSYGYGQYGQYGNYHHHGQQQGAPVYEPDCHPYCDINLPQGSSPVPLTTKEKRVKPLTEKAQDNLE